MQIIKSHVVGETSLFTSDLSHRVHKGQAALSVPVKRVKPRRQHGDIRELEIAVGDKGKTSRQTLSSDLYRAYYIFQLCSSQQ